MAWNAGPLDEGDYLYLFIRGKLCSQICYSIYFYAEPWTSRVCPQSTRAKQADFFYFRQDLRLSA